MAFSSFDRGILIVVQAQLRHVVGIKRATITITSIVTVRSSPVMSIV